MSDQNQDKFLESLSETEGAFAAVVAAVKDYAIFALDQTGHIKTWNEGAKRIKGYSKEEIVGKHFSTFYTLEDKQRNHPAFELQQALKNGSYEEEGWRVRKDGSVFWAAVTITPISIDGGGFVKVTRDLTERRRYEIELEEARDQAVAANKLKSQFVANVTHELRTPLTSLVGLSELLSAGEITEEESKETAKTMFESSRALLYMLNDLLDFAKLEAGKTSIDIAPFSIKKLIHDVVELLRNKSDRKGLTLKFNITKDVPELLQGDAMRVRQVLINLVDNAIKFTESGAVEVNAEPKNEFVLVSVTDTGIGISPQKQALLFQPFTQVHGVNPKYTGTGLGLSIAEQYINLMGGKMGVASKEGLGSTFWFVLPVSTEVSSNE